ncbi:hypothetical protein SCUCBS95973_002173 [Sporothrix curviconia]|uniref:Uncharacterized protein n=1 Tax=Sporothrix curviconia TaxID=1260050 RepID=A0ABP0B4S7_9PEZI
MTAPEYVSLDTYIADRKAQDETLNTEFHSIRDEFTSVHKELNWVREEFRSVRHEIVELRHEVRQTAAEQQRSAAKLRNQLLSNPTLPIEPIAIFDETRGVVQPDASQFPRHAKEFYTFQNPTDRQRRKLEYLITFYDLVLPETMDASSSDENSSGDSKEFDDDVNDNIFKNRDHLAVHMLEGILGLSEDNFLMFMERAQTRAAAQVAAPLLGKKRAKATLPSGAPAATRPFAMGLPAGLAAATAIEASPRPQPIPPLRSAKLRPAPDMISLKTQVAWTAAAPMPG